jgi:microcystin-dependent protein
MSIVLLPYPLIDATIAYGSEVKSDLDAIVNQVNGSLKNVNIHPTADIVDTKLATIATAGKVSATALVSLGSIPNTSGVLPIVNGGTGSAANANAASGVVILDSSAKLPAVDGSQLTGIVSIPTGAINLWATASAPTGWLICDGTTFSNVTYPTLATLLGDTYGAHSGANYYLPNLKGRVPVGAGQGSTYADGVATTGTDFALATIGGMEKHKLVTAELAAHTHNSQIGSTGGVGIIGTNNSGATLVSSNITTSAGSDTAHNNMQAYLVLNYIIKT